MGLRINEKYVTVQGFSPDRIESTTILDTTAILAIRVASPVSYTINGAGVSGSMPVGVTVIARSTSSIVFAVATTVEIMGA